MSAIATDLVSGSHFDRRRRLASEALVMARATGDGPTLSSVLATASLALDGRQAVAHAWFDIAQQGLAAAEREHDPEGSMGALIQVIGTQASLGEVGGARSRLEEGERIADGLRLPRFRWHILSTRAMLAGFTGDLDQAERDTMEAAGVGQSSDLSESYLAGMLGSLLFPIRYNQGRVGELVPAMEALIGIQSEFPAWRLALAAALARSGRPDEAQIIFDWLAAEDCGRVPRDALFPLILCGLGMLCLLLEVDKATAASIYDHLLPHAGTFNWTTTTVTQPNDLGLASAASAAGELEVAERHFAASAALCERAGARPDLAWTHHDWAKTLAAGARTSDAKEHAEAARVIAEEIGMVGPDGPMPLVRKLLDG